MKTKHTPGEWYIDNGSWTQHTVGIEKWAINVKTKDGNFFCIGDADGEHMTVEELKANAKLMAAAPDMLKACLYMIDSFDLDDKSLFTKQQKASIGYTKTAINKATE